MKKKTLFRSATFILALLLIMTFSNTSILNALGAEKTVGDTVYGVSGINRQLNTHPIHATQVWHQYGIETTVSMSYAVTQGAGASTSVVGTLGGVGAQLAFGLGLSQNTSHTVTSNVSFKVSSGTANGFYRIAISLPGYNTIKREWSTDWVLNPSATRSIPYVPRPIENYHWLQKY